MRNSIDGTDIKIRAIAFGDIKFWYGVNKEKGFVPQLNIKTCGQNQKNKVFQTKQKPQKPLGYWGFVGRDNRIWTCGLFVPNEARYQTALYPEIKYSVFSISPCLWDNMWSKLVWPHVFCFSIRHKVAVLKGLREFGGLLMNWIVPCPERSALPNCATSRYKIFDFSISPVSVG